MTPEEWLERSTVFWRKNFKAYKASLISSSPIVIEWVPHIRSMRPHDSMVFIIYGNTLCVCGGLGDAVYSFPEPVPLDYLSRIKLETFARLVTTVPWIDTRTPWSMQVAKGWAKRQLSQLKAASFHPPQWLTHLAKTDGSREYFEAASASLKKDPYVDCQRAREVGNAGAVLDQGSICYLIGIQMAMEQLKEKGIL